MSHAFFVVAYMVMNKDLVNVDYDWRFDDFDASGFIM